MTYSPIRFSIDHPEFFNEVKEKVSIYFQRNNLSRKANAHMYFKSLFFGFGTIGLYLCLLLLPADWYSFLLCGLLGFFQACIGFNISHDALHGAYSEKPWVNKLLGASFYLIGANGYLWNISHNIVHHSFTNIHEHDEDLEIAPGLIRLHPKDPYNSFQKYQRFYAFPLYALSSINWVLRKDFVKFRQHKIGEYTTGKHSTAQWIRLILTKLFYYFMMLILPICVLDTPWYMVLIGFVFMHLVMGLTLGLVFQLAHVVENLDYPINSKDSPLNNWAIHQLQTTSNFAIKSRLAAFICGGLNMQVEHHLFPKVCHVHYPAISKIVKECADKYQIPYHAQDSFWSALRSHYFMLNKFGQAA